MKDTMEIIQDFEAIEIINRVIDINAKLKKAKSSINDAKRLKIKTELAKIKIKLEEILIKEFDESKISKK